MDSTFIDKVSELETYLLLRSIPYFKAENSKLICIDVAYNNKEVFIRCYLVAEVFKVTPYIGIYKFTCSSKLINHLEKVLKDE